MASRAGDLTGLPDRTSVLQVSFPLGLVGMLKAWWLQAVGPLFWRLTSLSFLYVCTKRK